MRTSPGCLWEGLEQRLLLTAWGQPEWEYRNHIVIDHNQATGSLTDFAVLMDVTAVDLAAHARTDARDILFTGDDGAAKLDHEIESYDSSSGHLLAWVKVPTLSSVQDTGLYMYFGNPDAPAQQNPQGVWPSSYLAVHHLEETAGTVTDSTSRHNDGTPLNNPQQNAPGKIDGGDAFDGVNDSIQLPQVYTATGAFTFEAWVNSAVKQGYMISQRDTSSNGVFLQYYPSSGSFEFYVNSVRLSLPASTNVWHYVVGGFDGTTASLSVDGGTPVTAAATVTWPAQNTYLADRATTGRAFQGSLDEIRLSNVARDASYIQTTYRNQNDPTSFYVVETTEANAALAVRNPSPVDGATDVPTDTSMLIFELYSPVGNLMDYTVITTPDVGSASATGVPSGIYTVTLNELAPDTTYTWEVTATDGTEIVNKTFTFTTGAVWELAQWRYRRRIVIDHTKVAANLTNFPVLVDITDSAFSTDANVDGNDFVFTAADATTRLNHEIESYHDNHLVAWVNVPLVSSTQDTVLYLYYGHIDSEIESQANPTAVWDSTYDAVHHLEETAGDILDSTGNGNNGTANGDLTQNTDGKVDGADSFDGVDDNIRLPQVFRTQNTFTIEGWVYADAKHGYIVGQRDTLNHGVLLQYYAPSSNFQFFVNSSKLTVSATANAWHYVVATFDGTTARLSVDASAPVAAAGSITWPSIDTVLGNNSGPVKKPFTGKLDEIRISNVARSTAYVQTAYNNQGFLGTFMTIGNKETANAKILVADVYPADDAQHIEFNPVLQAHLEDTDHQPIDWIVQIFRPDGWETLASGTVETGAGTVTVPTTGVDQYETEYTWRLTAQGPEGSGRFIDRLYSFTTRLMGNYQPMLSNPVPADGQTAVALNPTLQVHVKDIDGDLMNVTISLYLGGSWQVLQTYASVPTGTYTADATGKVSSPVTTYQWKVTATDPAGSGGTTEQVYSFKTGGLLQAKWATTVDMTGRIEGQIQPVMGDIDNDGDQEIVFAAGYTVYAINGKTGAIEWAYNGNARDTAVELADVDNDGTPEILYGMYGPRVGCLKGNGTVLWISPKLPGEDQCLYPILAYDIDGDGYPTIYFASEDQTPNPYSGDLSDYTGAISMLDHNGNFLASSWLYHPCWGGISLGDVNNDGYFELYVSDRRAGYNGVPSLGPHAFDAATLEPLWTRPDILASSPMMVLADVTGDGLLDVIDLKITLAGPIVLDGMTGQTIYDYSNRGLPTHGTPTVYDIDEDGHLEIIMSTSYPSSAPKNFVVFDLVSGTIEFAPTFPYHAAQPPTLGDITGDGKMEILAAMGDQSTTTNYPLLVYDNEYNLLDEVLISGAGQLTAARVFDTDSDGFNELVVTGYNGKIVVFDTQAPTPDPAPRTWVQHYSEYRRGAAEYVEPGPTAPIVRDVSPADGQNDVGLEPVLSFQVLDYQKDLFDVTVEIRVPDGGQWQWVTLATYADQHDGTFTADTEGYATDPVTTYSWRVTATDEYGHSTQKTFTFTTMLPSAWGMPDWQYRRKIVIDHTEVAAGLTNFPVLIKITDADLASHAQNDGDDFLFTASDTQTQLAHEIESYDSATGQLVAWVNVPNLSATQDTVLFLYYGNPSAPNQQNVEGVWSSSYLAVHHLEELSGSILDSTAYNNDGTALNGVQLNAAGQIDGADSFDGVNDRIRLPQVFTSQTTFTIEGWIYTGNKQGYVISQRNTASQGAFLQYYPTNGSFQFYINSGCVSVTATPNQWHYVVATFDGTTARLYVDAGSPAQGTATVTWPSEGMYLGDRSSTGRAFLGRLDEIRLSDVARGTGYIATSYANQVSPETFYVVGARERAVTKPIVYNPVPADPQQKVSYQQIGQLEFSLLDCQGDAMNYTITTTPDIGGASGVVVGSGTVVVPLHDVAPYVTYTWQVEVTDGTEWTYRTFTFTTYDPAELLTDWTFEASTDSADLRANSLSQQDWFESRNNVPTLLELDEAEVGGRTGKKAKLVGDPNGNAYLSQEFREPQTGQFSVEWDINVDDILDISIAPDRAGWMMIGNETDGSNGPNSTNSERFVQMAFAKNGGGTSGTMDLVARDRDDTNTNFTVVASGLQLDQWYTIRIDLDLDADTYSIYVDGVFKATVTSRATQTSVSYISFAQWNDGAGTFFVDNVHTAMSMHPPVAYDDTAATSQEVPVVTGNVLANDFDMDGDTLVVDSYTQPDHGAVSYNGDGTFTYTPEAGYNGSDSFTYTAGDGYGGTDTATVAVTIYPHNDAPVATDDEVTTDEDTPVVTGNVLANDSDVDGGTLMVDSFAQPDHGAVSYNGDGTFTYTPEAGYTGSDSFTYTIIDGQGGSDTATVAVTVNPVGVELLSDSTFDTSTDSTDLRADQAGVQDWYESRNNVPTLLELDEAEVGGRTGKKAKFTGSSTGNAYLSQEFSEPQTGQFSLEWDIYVDEILNISGSPDRAGWMLIGNDSDGINGPNSANAERFVLMAFAKSGGGTGGTMDLVARDRDDSNTNFTVIASDLLLDQWYTIRVDLDLDADTYSIYVDGVFKATVTSRTVQTSVAYLSFAQWNDGAGTFFVDNVHTAMTP
jgi:hypothetical protein